MSCTCMHISTGDLIFLLPVFISTVLVFYLLVVFLSGYAQILLTAKSNKVVINSKINYYVSSI